MRKLALILFWMMILCFNSNSVVYGKPLRTINGIQNLKDQINQAVRRVNSKAKVGIVIKSLRYNDYIYAKNDKSLFVPASTLKIMTAEAALLFLGPEYKFQTRFVTDAKSLKNGVLNGNLYLVHSGDPTLTFYDLAELINSLRAKNIKKITGNIYVDNTAYDNVTTGPGWLWNDKRYCYGAPISASIINHNCLSFRVKPTTLSGQGTKIITDTRLYYSKIRSNLFTHTRASNACYAKLNTEGGTISISGCLGKNNIVAVSSVINNVMQYNKVLLEELLYQSNIQLYGVIKPGMAYPSYLELARHESQPLYLMVNEMMKMSDNIIAGSLFKKIGALYTHRPGTWENGGIAVAKILSKRAALDIWRMSLIDGSGLSRYNQVTPAQMLRVLDFTFHNNLTNYQFISALPVAGVDGTLKRRMRNIPWRVRAKTGTMKGVVSLAGYAMSADREPFAFVIIVNSRSGGVGQFREMEDKIMNLLTHYSR